MKPEVDGIRAPRLAPMRWLNGEAPSGPRRRGRVLLVDFWDFTSHHCLRAIPYLRAWHERYAERGLTVAGVHVPEFPFARDPAAVEAAVAELEIPYPVALDSDYRTWEAFHNRFWPTRYLFDAGGTLRYYHVGEGDYRECEREIQGCLRALDPDGSWPEPLPPLRPEDAPGATVPAATPEVFLGLERGRLGNPEAVAPGDQLRFELPGRREAERAYAEGWWRAELRYLESTGSEPAALHLRATAAEIHLVAAAAEPIEIEVLLDGAPVVEDERGEDLRESSAGVTLLPVSRPRLHRVVAATTTATRDLRLRVEAPGVRLYAVSFAARLARPSSP